jgi:ribokinase
MSHFAFDIIVCGSLHLDIMVDAPYLPRLDETAVGTAWGMKCGGKGGNQAVMAARLGARTAMIGRIGADDFGTRLLAHLDEAGVNRNAVETDPVAGSGMSVALVDPQGDYGAVIVSGSNLRMPPEQCAQQFLSLGGASILVLQNEIPEAVNLAVAKTARAAGARVLLNAAPARPLSAEFLDQVDILVVNRVEAEMMSGLTVSDQASAEAALPALRGHARDVIITLGGEGLVFGAKSGAPHRLAPHKVAVVSTHGAGDSFLGTLAIMFTRGASLADACDAANRVAARFVSLTEDQRAISSFRADAELIMKA